MFYYRRVRDLREDSDKTQRDIAQILNMQTTVYQRYERGERELPLWAAIKLLIITASLLIFSLAEATLNRYIVLSDANRIRFFALKNKSSIW
jgi:transcriptional regulator with XRE-family HTH domain